MDIKFAMDDGLKLQQTAIPGIMTIIALATTLYLIATASGLSLMAVTTSPQE